MPDLTLEEQLKALQTNLETSTDAKVKAGIEAEIKKVTQQLVEATKEIPALRTELNETKATVVILKDAADKNQKVIDDLQAKQQAPEAKPENKDFNSLLGDAVLKNAEGIKEIILARKVKNGIVIDLKATKDSIPLALKAAGDMSFSANASTLDVSTTTLRPGIIALPSRRLHVRQLLQGGNMTGSTFTFLREKTTGEGNPATVTEANWKEQLDIDLEEVDSPSQYIAGYLVCSTKMFDDIPGFVSFLQARLLEKLLRAEDVQLISGDGNSPNLGGITKSGNFTAPTGTATIDELQIVEAIAQVEMYDREANGVLVSPQDYYRIFEYTASSSGEFTFTRLSQIVNGQLYIAGVPIFRSTALATDKFIAGDWNMGAQLITREAPKVEIFYEDAYNVRRNQVTVRVEERVAFPVYGSDYFIYGDFGHS